MHKNTCIIIAGPTAVGKTALAIQLAQHFHTEIISADSRQCYREMNIGVAKPSQQELDTVKHYFISSHSIHEEVNAASFEEYALKAAGEIFTKQPVAVMVGGTGLYIKAFCEGLDDIPPVPPAIREAIITQYGQYGLTWLQQQVSEQDPLYFSTGEIQNPQRLIRALEVKQATGQSIREFQQGKRSGREFNILKVGLQLPREMLHRNINHRTDVMLQQGLLQEVQGLLPWRNLNALQTVGYSELFEYIDGHCILEEATDAIKRNTRRYAKRQMTWFNRDADIHWFTPSAIREILNWCSSQLK